MMLFSDAFYVLLPEWVILITACSALLLSLFFKRRFENIAYTTALVGLAISVVCCFFLLSHERVLLFDGAFVSDYLGQLMKCFIGISVWMGFVYSRDFLREQHMAFDEFFILALFSMLGMMTLVSAHSMLTIYLGLEVLSLPLYAMTAMLTKREESGEAAIKYFVMGAMASGMILYGFSLLYGVTGKLDLTDVANNIAIHWGEQHMVILFALIFVLAGAVFKLAAVPFHMWAPDVYQGAPSCVTLFISAAPKIAALGMLLRLLMLTFSSLVNEWQQVLILIALLSTGIGNLFAVAQTQIRRLFAYSAIAHSGYALFGLLAGSQAGYAASIFYMLIYSLMSVALFGFLVLLSRQGVEIEHVNDLKGLNARHPWIAFLMMICLFSMAGVPPMIGFFTKLAVLKVLIDAGMVWIAVLGLIFAVIGAYYYIKVVKVMYFDEPERSDKIVLPFSSMTVLSLNSLSLLVLGLFPQSIMMACWNAVGSS